MHPKRSIETDDLIVHEVAVDFHLVVMKSSMMTEVAFQEMLDAHLKLSGGKKAWVLADTTKMKMMTRPAMLFARDNAHRMALGLAILAPNKVSRVIGEFFIRVVKPNYLVKIFDDKQLAMNWINDQRTRES